jgi:hypothetical protein
MERVVKRFLMHNQNDFDDPKQNEYDEFKQDLQLIRFEIINNFKKAREDSMRNMFCINAGLEFLVNEITVNKSPSIQFVRYKELINDSQINNNLTSVKSESEIANEDKQQKIISFDLKSIEELHDDENKQEIDNNNIEEEITNENTDEQIQTNKNYLDLKICINDIDRISTF